MPPSVSLSFSPSFLPFLSLPPSLTHPLPPSLRQVKQSEDLAKEETKPFEHKDYSLKEGQKIRISLGVSKLTPLMAT